MKSELLMAALACREAGVSIIPIDHGTKRPAANLLPRNGDGKPTWKPFQSEAADEATVRQWVAAGSEAFAVVGGAVSGGLLVLDFDGVGVYQRWASAVGELARGLPVQQTGGGGYQVLLRCPDPGGNDKLAWMPDEGEPTGRTIAIETRATGGYAVVAPSLHPSGTRYRWLSGDLSDIPLVTQDHAEKLLAAARVLDEVPLTRQERERLEGQARAEHQRRQASRNGQSSVIAAFNEAHSIETMLESHGYAKGRGDRYIRPGGTSESVSVKDGRTCHWSTDDPLNDGRAVSGCGCHDAFDLYSHYDHGGDVSAAVKAAAASLGIKRTPARQGRDKPAPVIEPYRAFPIDVLPPVLARFVHNGAQALGCDPAYVALPLLAALASAIGNTRRLRLKASWSEPSVLWCVIVGDSGTLKSPAFDLALRDVRRRQGRAMKEFERAKAAYRDERERYDEAIKAWRKAKPEDRGERPEEPASPVCERLWCSDTTVEALAERLGQAWRGLLLARDELAGWLASFNQYKAGQGGDVAHWLEVHRAGHLLVDRKTGDKTTTYVPRAAVCIAGGMQPETLRRSLTPEFFENGLAARLLLAMPPKRVKRWTDAEVDPRIISDIESLFGELLQFQPSKDTDGQPEPADIPLTSGAKLLFVEFYDRHAQEQMELGGDLSAAWSKLEGYAGRLALVLHSVRQASEGVADPWQCDEHSMEAGIALAEWFGHEARRVYGMLAESREDHEQRDLVDWIKQRGGQVTVRDLTHGLRRYRGEAAGAEGDLERMAQAKIGRWQSAPQNPKGGRQPRIFHLLPGVRDDAALDTVTAVTVTETPSDTSAPEGNGDGDTGDTSSFNENWS
jgi:hypothetical protein